MQDWLVFSIHATVIGLQQLRIKTVMFFLCFSCWKKLGDCYQIEQLLSSENCHSFWYHVRCFVQWEHMEIDQWVVNTVTPVQKYNVPSKKVWTSIIITRKTKKISPQSCFYPEIRYEQEVSFKIRFTGIYCTRTIMSNTFNFFEYQKIKHNNTSTKGNTETRRYWNPKNLMKAFLSLGLLFFLCASFTSLSHKL